MRVLGASFRSDEMMIAVIDVQGDAWTLVDTGTRKVSCGDHEDADSLRGFRTTVRTLINSHSVDRVVVRKCIYKGQKRSGAAAIKMEAMLQLLDNKVSLVSPQTISAALKKTPRDLPAALNAYQNDAFYAAVSIVGIS